MYIYIYSSIHRQIHAHTPRGTVVVLSVRLLHLHCAHVCVCACMRVCAEPLCWHSRGMAGIGGIYSSARDGRVCVCFWCHLSTAALAAGITWTPVIASAPWAARFAHTSVVGAAGAIYVIGGASGDVGDTTYFNDVWASTDGGAGRTRAGCSGLLKGYSGGTKGALSTRSRFRGIKVYALRTFIAVALSPPYDI